ncbi:ComF family protein [Spirillospora albida]|uniref:ComF family protein n=1 Tax=Spirillospora albida TaxID=58123 RepID=UPI00055F563B|nr:phosphoribosyltransferase family protein [Spirillospora albida]
MRLLGDLLDLLLPERCAGCGGGPGLLCATCTSPLLSPPRRADAPAGLPPPWTVAPYDGSLRAVLSAYKEHGRTALAAPLGDCLARAVHAALRPVLCVPAETAQGAREGPGGQRALTGEAREVLIVPVPSARGAVRRRGHDPVRTLAAVAVRRLRAEGRSVAHLDALAQRRRVEDQTGLSAGGRAANLAGALAARPVVEGRDVVLVDDVITTGSTLAEAARAVRAAGGTPRAAATIAATPRLRRR